MRLFFRSAPCRAGLVSLFLIFLSAAAQAQDPTPLYRDQTAPLQKRVDDLVSRMTLEEKVSQMQDQSAAIPRLGIPEYNWWNEGLHGVARAGVATVFPQAIGLAATWDRPLLRQVGDVVSTEARAKYNQAIGEENHQRYYGLTFWSPNINIFRDPRWGRGQETFGEDPFLTAALGVQFVRGLQGDDPSRLKVVATPKHFAVHSGPEPLRHGFNVNVSAHDLEDTYLPAFRAAVQQARATSVMCAYNAIDGKPACANERLLTETLRNKWGFGGAVVSDCDAITDVYKGHGFVPDQERAAVTALRAGTDLSCGTEYGALAGAVRKGLVREDEIDAALKRLLALRFRLGMFDEGGPYSNLQMVENDSPSHRALALQTARESIVLLKNDGLLPLRKDLKAVAIVGPNAASLRALLGNYHGTPADPVTPADGLSGSLLPNTKVIYAQGAPLVSEVPVPAPRSLFRNKDSKDNPALRAEYFDNAEFAGKPVYVTSDPQIDFDWSGAAPHNRADIHPKAFSVRWSGALTVPAPGTYTFSAAFPHCYPCGDTETFRVFLDGKMIAQQTVEGNPRRPEESAPFQVEVADTLPHEFVMEYSHRSPLFGAGITLNWKPPIDVLRSEAVEAAQQADVVIAFVGLSPGLEGEEMKIDVEGFKGGDRTDINLPRVQEQLLEALASTGKPLVVVLMNGSAMAVNWAQQKAAAVLEAWYPGEAGGTAIAETLLGSNNPSGRLPITFYSSLDQLPGFENYSMQGRTYRYFNGKPLYGFGFGLSFSKFKYSDVRLSATTLKPGDSLTAQADVQNASAVPGDEVVQLYMEYPASPGSPKRALRGFERIHLLPGEIKHITFNLGPDQLGLVTAEGANRMVPGAYSLFIGGGQPEDGVGGVKQDFRIEAGTMRIETGPEATN